MKPVLVASLASLTFLAAATASHAAAAPTLHLVGHRPFVVRGESFRAGERIVVTAVTPTGPKKVTVKATTAGRFRATLRLSDQPCGRATVVVAKGRAGSLATLRLGGAPCVPPPID